MVFCSEFPELRVVVELARVPVISESSGISGGIHHKVFHSVARQAGLSVVEKRVPKV